MASELFALPYHDEGGDRPDAEPACGVDGNLVGSGDIGVHGDGAALDQLFDLGGGECVPLEGLAWPAPVGGCEDEHRTPFLVASLEGDIERDGGRERRGLRGWSAP